VETAKQPRIEQPRRVSARADLGPAPQAFQKKLATSGKSSAYAHRRKNQPAAQTTAAGFFNPGFLNLGFFNPIFFKHGVCALATSRCDRRFKK
jgi:hypothetical protein